MRTNISTFVTLDTVFGSPLGNESCHTTFFIFGGSLRPSTVFDTFECRNFEQITVLSIDRTHHFIDESRIVIGNDFIIGKIGPCRIYGKLFVFASAVYGCVVFIDNVLTFLAVRLHDEFLHLFDGEINGDNAGNTEECRLQNGIGTVTETYFLCNLGSIDIVNRDILLSEITFYVVGQVLCQFFFAPNGIEKERSILTKTTGYIVHTQISLYVASNEIRRIHEIGRTNGIVSETQVRTGETT